VIRKARLRGAAADRCRKREPGRVDLRIGHVACDLPAEQRLRIRDRGCGHLVQRATRHRECELFFGRVVGEPGDQRVRGVVVNAGVDVERHRPP